MNSKLELRNEAVRLAVNTEGVTADNVIEVSKKIEAYITGNSELPELYDTSEFAMKVMQMATNRSDPKNYIKSSGYEEIDKKRKDTQEFNNSGNLPSA